MVGIRLEGPEVDVLDVLDSLQSAGLVCNVSKLYANRKNEDEIRAYAQIEDVYRWMRTLEKSDIHKDVQFGNGAAGWYACVRYKLENGRTKDTNRVGPFETEEEARTNAVNTAKDMRAQGKQCFEIWELCDKYGVPIEFPAGLV